MPQSALSISRLFIELANKNEKVCSGKTLNGLQKFRTEGNNPDPQTFCFNVINNEQLFNVYISKQINDS